MHWLLVGSESNWLLSRERGFNLAGMKARWKKAAGEVRPGDTVFFYLIGLQVIAGECLVTGDSYFDDSPIWDCTKIDEQYPWRFATEPTVIREPDDYLSVKDFLTEYEYAQRWSPQRSSLAFQGNVHRLNDRDYQLIHAHLINI
ncbi:MAG: hypothetical protein ABIV43_02525 [Candidatus Saccharimonadales bacterium]